MTDLQCTIIKDHGNGEVEIEITTRFTIYRPTMSIAEIKRKFQDAIDTFAI